MDAIIQLSEAKNKIKQMEADLETSLKMSEAYASEISALKDEYAKYKTEAEAALAKVSKECIEKVQAAELAQKDFDSKLEAKAAEKALVIAASVGVPPIPMTPNSNPAVAKITPDAPKAKGFKLVQEAFEKELKEKK